MENDINGFYLDDGTKIDPNLIPKPSLCVSCIHDDDPSEEILCTLNRIDQRDDPEFKGGEKNKLPFWASVLLLFL